jgi:predicted phage terminase large subunit-like protein
MEREREHAEFLHRFPSPGALAVGLAPHNSRQTPALEAIDRELLGLTDGDTNRLMIFCPPQEGKAVSDITPVATPGGWIRHGELRPGDVVFHPSGRQIKVAEIHPPVQLGMRVHFSDHTSILVHPRHEWTVWDRALRKFVTRETGHLARLCLDSGDPGKRGHRYRFQLPFREALDLPDANLPVEPYTLGVWLGDGTTGDATITHHPADRYQLPYEPTSVQVHRTTGIHRTYYKGLRADLKTAGVFHSKHIPAAYLRASERQRRALLAGLIDTDGHVSASGQVSFDNADERLVRDTAELIRTLGYRAHVHRPTPPKLSTSGIQGMQPMWRVTYTPHDQGPARLARKAAVKLGIRRRVAITAITEETPQTGRCITVDSADGLYLVGEGMTPTHNSTRTACWFPLWRLIADPTLRIAIVSYSQGKAERWGKWIRQMIEGHPELGVTLMPGSRASARFETTAGGKVISVGIEGGITGEAVDLLIIDDPVRGRAEAESPTYRNHAWEWWESNAMTRASGRFQVVLMMTRWHGDDLAGRLLKEEPGEWQVLRIPAIREEGQPIVRGNDGASVYNPNGELISVQDRPTGWFYQLREKRSSYVWRSVYAQNPVTAEGNLFRKGDFRYWYNDTGNADPSRSDATGGARIRLGLDSADYRYVSDMRRFLTVDLAASTKTSADWTVAAVWGITGDGLLILLDQDRQRIEETDHFGIVRPLAERWAAPDVYVEKGFIGSTLVIDATRAGLRVRPLTPDKDKVTRAIPAANRVRAHRVYFPSHDDAGWLGDWINELAEFPAGAHDDRVDVLSYAARVMAAHWLEPDNNPAPREHESRANRTAAEMSYESATGWQGGLVDIARADW